MKNDKKITSPIELDQPISLVHGKPKTRRDFLTSGVVASAGYVATPSIISMLAGTQALGQDAKEECPSGQSNGIPCLIIELAGGANIPGRNIKVGGKGGQMDNLPGSGYRTIGLNGDPNSVDAAMGLRFHTGSRMLAGVKQTATPDVLNNVQGTLFCHFSVDDIASSTLNPIYAFQKCGATGSLAHLIGAMSTASGGRMPAPGYDPSFRPSVVNNANDPVNMVNLGSIADLFGSTGMQKILKATEMMSSSQLRRFTALDIDEQVKTLVRCGYVKPIKNVENFTPAAVDASLDSVITDNFDMNNGNQARLGAMCKMLKDGYAGAATFVAGGNDYHDGTSTTGDARDRTTGQYIGRALSTFAAENKPLVIYVFTDGGVSSPNGVTWTSDSGTRSGSFMLVYNPSGRVALRGETKHQIGNYNSAGAFDRSGSPINSSDKHVVAAVAANYLALTGREGQLRQLLREDPFGEKLDQILAFTQLG